MNIEKQLQEDYIHDFHLVQRKNQLDNKKKFKTTFFSPWQPNHPFRLVWDIISMLFIIIQMMIIPLMLSFEIEDERTQLFMEIMDDFFLADILIQFNSAIFINGKLVLKRKEITINYLKFWFWLDLISSLPYDYFVEGGDVQMIRMLRFFKFLKVIKMIKAVKLGILIRRLETFLGSDFSSLFEFFKLAFIITVIAHWCACIFNLINQDDYDYLSSFYFTITTMITIGYGDIHPVSTEEQMYAVFAMILATGVFGYAANSMISIFQYQDPQLVEIVAKSQIINKYTKQHDCSIILRNKIQNYLEWIVENDYEVRASLILNDLSEELRNQVINHMNLRFFKTLPVSMSKAFKLSETILPPETKLDDPNHIYYIIQGKVSIMANETFLGFTDNCFGQINFFSDIPRTAELVTAETTNLVKISRQQFLKSLNQEQFERFHQIKQKLENFDFLDLDLLCICCGKKGHVAKYCPRFHYFPIRNYFYQQGKFIRQKKVKLKTRYNQVVIEYYQIMQARQIKKFSESKIKNIQQHDSIEMDIDQIQSYQNFDPDWNINTVLQFYKSKMINNYYKRIIKRNLKFLIRQNKQKNKNVVRLKTEITPTYKQRYEIQILKQN